MQKIIKYLVFSLLLFGFVFPATAHINPKLSGKKNTAGNASVRQDCSGGEESILQDINNVRATLLMSGDVWWDGSGDARYVVPKVDPASGLPEVSSIFSGAVWLGGFDENNVLKVACQQYGSSDGNYDFYPGPLTEIGTTSQDTCANWDRHFKVFGDEIRIHLANYNQAVAEGRDYDPDQIPENIKYWPARGNQYFTEKFDFELPDNLQGLGAFWEDPETGNGRYDPEFGEYPVIEIRGCDEPQYPDEMVFWIYNDAGNVHGETGGSEIRMEVQVQAFGYKTNDELNNMTFQRYKLINRAITDIDSCYFAMWVDADLGCHLDDYIGCDTTRSLMFIYNADAEDGSTGCTCTNGINTYCDEIPILGVDYFRGPLGPKVFDADSNLVNPPLGVPGDTIVELGMSSFTYFNNGAEAPEAGTDDPDNAQEFYNYLSGTWKDGLPFTAGEDAHTPGATNVIKFAFPDPPDLVGGWSMEQEGLPGEDDRRTVQASGPFRLEPGAVNELIIGVPWVPNVAHPAPSIRRLQVADDLAQALFDNCFDITDGPDAPDVDWIELDQAVVALLSNDTDTALTNNSCELYREKDLRAPPMEPDSFYVFEGYQIYQLASPASASEDINDPEHFRLIAQVDIKNEVADLYNWTAIENPSALDDQGNVGPEFIYVPEVQVIDAPNAGIRHMFKITEDQFGTDNKNLINHKKYYFRVIAYAYNNYEQFNPQTEIGQRNPYLVGRRNIGDGINSYYTVIPRPIVDQTLHSDFGDQPAITRLSGVGAGENNLRLTDETVQAILNGNFDGNLLYKPGAGPLNVTVYNPLALKESNFELTIIDDDTNDDELNLDDNVRWILDELDGNGNVVETYESKTTIDALNEELVCEYGFAIAVVQSDVPGDNADDSNGSIDMEVVYADSNGAQWLAGVPDGDGIYDYIKTASGEIDNSLDENSSFSTWGNGTWVPYTLCDWRPQPDGIPLLSPSWNSSTSNIVRSGNPMSALNNVDIVFTPNKDLWSRCIVVETSTTPYYDCTNGACIETEGGATNLNLRKGQNIHRDGSRDSHPDSTGMGWFPGYAIDVETGERLNIFFGENSSFSCDEPFINLLCEQGAFQSGDPTGRDMIWNPSDERFVASTGLFSMANIYEGGQHYIYVTREKYDRCAALRAGFNEVGTPPPSGKIGALRKVTWASFPLMATGESLLPLSEGLIPNEVTIHLRVDNDYGVSDDKEVNNGYPTYRFSTVGMGSQPLQGEEEINEALDMINVVPNPYYGFSSYETSQFTNTIKITNLPAVSTITIYSLDGKFIRQYKRNEQGISNANRNNPAIKETQFAPDVEWDLRNNAGIPVASGVYLIHVDAEGMGERVIKWYGVARQFDPSGL